MVQFLQAGYGLGVSEARVHREIERKLEVPPRFRLPDLSVVDGVGAALAQPTLKLVAVYYDTADLRLARSRITLRRRTGGGDDGWHLKLPHADEATRDEVQLPLGTEGEPPEELVSLVLGITRGAPLMAVATLKNERRPTLVRDEQGAPLAEVTDDHVSVVKAGKVAARFREVEVEAADGRTDADLEPVVDALIAAGATPSGFASKAVRALGPDAVLPPDITQPPAVHPSDPATAAMTALIAKHAAAFQAQDLRVRRDLPDSVHQMRVAARRLRSALKVFAPLFDEAWSNHLRTELKWVGNTLGDARDGEVLQARLLHGVEALGEHDAPRAVAVIMREMDLDACAARAKIVEALTSSRYVELLETLVRAANTPEFTPVAHQPCDEVLPPLMRAAWKQLRRDAEGLQRKGPDDTWHAARIRAKHARYAAEALAPVFGKPAARLGRQLARVTELLGRHQDAAITAEAARDLAEGDGVDGRAGYVLGLLHREQRDEVKAIRRTFLQVWPQVAAPRLRRWLRQ